MNNQYNGVSVLFSLHQQRECRCRRKRSNLGLVVFNGLRTMNRRCDSGIVSTRDWKDRQDDDDRQKTDHENYQDHEGEHLWHILVGSIAVKTTSNW